MDVPGNKIGDSGAIALVEALKEMRNLEKLYLHSECCMVGIACEVVVMSCIKQVAGLCGVRTGTAVRGPRAMMTWAWLESVDIVGARAKL